MPIKGHMPVDGSRFRIQPPRGRGGFRGGRNGGRGRADSDHDSSESDDEFQICDICNSEEGRKKLLQCSCCSQFVHPACLIPPMIDLIPGDWTCHSCKEKTDEYLKARHEYLAELLRRYQGAMERKSKLLEIIRTLDLPNNPLDDIIDQLGGPDKVAEMTGRRRMLVRAFGGKGVTYQARNTKDVTMEMVNMHEKQLFMDGKKLVAIISEAGSAGVSLQADRRAVNQVLIVPNTYLTQGDRRAGPSLSAYNYDSAYGKRALMVMYRGIMEQIELCPRCHVYYNDSEKLLHACLAKKLFLCGQQVLRDCVYLELPISD